MQICIFEDTKFSNFEPLALSRPVYELVCGISTLKEKILRNFKESKYSLHCRKYLQESLQQDYPDIQINELDDEEDCLLLNGRLLTRENLKKIFNLNDKSDKVYLSGENIAAVKLSGNNLKDFILNFPDTFSVKNFPKLPVEIIEINLVNYLWDLINYNGEEIKRDFEYLTSKVRSANKVYKGVHFVNIKKIHISKGVKIKPGAVIDASNGPVFIDKEAIIYPNVVIEGPAYIGEKTKIKSAATIYENVSIGKVCKVGGEVEDIIMLPYSNKQHSGFLGHAYLGSWINIGASTNNSDLKNNYSNVRITVNGKEVDSGLQFLGLIMGDHSKCGINTMFNTGTTVGFSCNIFGAGYPSKYIPSFSWGSNESFVVYKIDKFLQTARMVLKRRDKELTEADVKLIDTVFNLTRDERMKRGIN